MDTFFIWFTILIGWHQCRRGTCIRICLIFSPKMTISVRIFSLGSDFLEIILCSKLFSAKDCDLRSCWVAAARLLISSPKLRKSNATIVIDQRHCSWFWNQVLIYSSGDFANQLFGKHSYKLVLGDFASFLAQWVSSNFYVRISGPTPIVPTFRWAKHQRSQECSRTTSDLGNAWFFLSERSGTCCNTKVQFSRPCLTSWDFLSQNL